MIIDTPEIIELVEKLPTKHFFEHALDLFITGAIIPDLAPEEYDSNEAMIEGKIKEFLEKDHHGHMLFTLHNCAVEFVCSNEYYHEGVKWSVIDDINKTLKTGDSEYLTQLKNSYMSIYEVVTVNSDKTLMLRNLIEKDQPLIHVQEALDELEEGELIGARIVNLKGLHYLTSGFTGLSPDSVNRAIETITRITGLMSHNIDIKKMWAKEIIYELAVEFSNTPHMGCC